jgi:hypothetical protein
MLYYGTEGYLVLTQSHLCYEGKHFCAFSCLSVPLHSTLAWTVVASKSVPADTVTRAGIHLRELAFINV